jgi:7-keto-8-aminopelargonate synthetase-like enzyme
MARSVLQIVNAHPELTDIPNVIPSLHYLAATHRIGSWKATGRGFVKHFGPTQELQLLERLRTSGGSSLRYDPYS